ncbi:MAG TPA: VOC family protein [Alphaproteobacteria bacterium]|jgi:predicted enzyme related to lactoylglutathione lyase
MTEPNMIILYVESPAASAAFYASLLGKPPVEASPTFAMFEMNANTMLGLWSRATVAPAATQPGGGEIAFTLPDAAAVDAAHRQWQKQGLEIAQAPTEMDFGRTFVALDPDRHRLRVYAPARP